MTGDCKSPHVFGASGFSTRHGFLFFSGGTSMAQGRPWGGSVTGPPAWTFFPSPRRSLRALPMGRTSSFMGIILPTERTLSSGRFFSRRRNRNSHAVKRAVNKHERDEKTNRADDVGKRRVRIFLFEFHRDFHGEQTK